MPQLRFKAIDENKALSISKELINELQELIQCPREYFSIELVESRFIMDNEFVKGPQMIDVYWFDRGQVIQDKAAKIITKHIFSVGYKSIDVIFHNLEHSKYYENGEHF